MIDLHDRPLVTVVTPSLNQGRFLRATIDSVLSQTYPRIDYHVLDGGSTDGTLDILRSYGDRVHWVSAKDGGQSQAINKGFQRARGEILAWLNADDLYVEDAVERAVLALQSRPHAGWVYGRGEIIDESGALVGAFREVEPFCLWRLLYYLDYILQPTTFFRRELAGRLGYVDEGLRFGMDWDLWIRLAAESEAFFVDEVLARSRVHDAAKTSTGGWRRIRELGRITRRHTGRFWTPGVQLYALEQLRRDALSLAPRRLRDAVNWLHHGLARRIDARAAVRADGRLGRRGALVVPRRWPGAHLVFELDRQWPAAAFDIELHHGRRRLARLRVDRPGRHTCEVRWPAGSGGPFVSAAIRCRCTSGRPIDCPPGLTLRETRPLGPAPPVARSATHPDAAAVAVCAASGREDRHR